MLAEHKLDEEQIEIDAGEVEFGDDLSGVLEFTPGMSPEEMSEFVQRIPRRLSVDTVGHTQLLGA